MFRFIACRSQIYTVPSNFQLKNLEFKLFLLAYPALLLVTAFVDGNCYLRIFNKVKKKAKKPVFDKITG